MDRCDQPKARCRYDPDSKLCIHCGRKEGWKQVEDRWMKSLIKIEAKYGVAVRPASRNAASSQDS